ncbi:isoprenylcysteine carboxylmethyltransferase family protein [Candidatus Nitronereus thalassa]|uniref:Isoprenylcysteine carboxylmethyltransferase family protein n=1 Tax=Candidatus Nitronereus thalassa TaxID=3020898 RepID=A0ABU3K2Z8_9BACT|nr:isoprenylcysteine carboxylmethyltransferase family protein [Candidatus Nitronereus thalassa]MDT7040770.1 isoprenylcysteine carboxylmethyltransferase family protein [Candidatus Nitronereus thalassa]
MHSDTPAGGVWGLTAVMVVIASWILYRYVAPRRWREWSRAGLIQAFIIALYAEMYGFPLTIYLLSGFLGFDIPWLHQSGHLWATLFGWGHTGAMLEMLVGYAIVFFGISLLIEGWREVYLATQGNQLATHGLYGLVRHPQYTGIFLAIFGQLIHWPTIPTLLLFPIVVWAYYRLAKKEEQGMMDKFETEYRNYQNAVPMFFPRMANWKRFLGFQPVAE